MLSCGASWKGKTGLQEDPQISSTLRRNDLMIRFLEVVEEGQKSQRKYDYLAIALRKVHSEVLELDDKGDETQIHGDSTTKEQYGNNDPSLPTTGITLLDPLHVSSKGRPKSIRHKHPLETQSGKKRECSICKQIGHIKTNCPSLNQTL